MANLVGPEGHKDSKIAIIGEAPGVTEVARGRPFVGRAGEVLDDLLHRAGILRQQCYITNVVKERPDRNDITHFIDLALKEPRISPEGRRYIGMLYEELADVQANVLVPTGKTSLYVTTGKRKITAQRGSILQAVPELGGRKVVPTIHPAATFLRLEDKIEYKGKSPRKDPYIYRYYIIHDLRRAAVESKTPEIHLPSRTLLTAPSFNEVIEYLQSILDDKPTVAFDIETSGRYVSCISFAKRPDLIMTIPFLCKEGDYFTLDQEIEVWLMIAKILEDPDVRKVAQYGIAFDSTLLYSTYGIVPRNTEDTQVAHKIFCPDFPATLEFMTSMLTREPYYKDEGKEAIEGLVTNFQQHWEYCAKDSAVTLECWEHLEGKLKEQGNWDAYCVQRDVTHPILFMQERGMCTLEEKIAEAAEEARKEIEELTKKFHEECGGVEINPSSSKQLQAYYYGALGIKPYKNRQTGKPTMNEEAVIRLARKKVPGAATLLKIKKKTKLQTTYFSVPLTPSGRLKCGFNPGGTVTGRLSSKRNIFGYGTNMQTIPPRMKQYVVADEGYMLFEVDLSRAEDMIVAFITPEPTKVKAYEDGEDTHRLTFGLMFGIPPEEVSDEPGSSKIGDGSKSQRYWGKQCNHAFNYDRGYRSFSLAYEIPEAEGKTMWERYHRVYPAIQQRYHVRIQRELRATRTIDNCYGKKRRFLGRWGNEMFKEAYSQIPQSTVGYKVNKDGLIATYFNPTFAPIELLNQVHDSMVFQIPVKIGFEPMAQLLRQIQANMELPVPNHWQGGSFIIPAEVKGGTVWAFLRKLKYLTPEELETVYKEAKESGG